MSEAVPVVFVVDDDVSYLKATARLLRAAGYRVETFSSVAEFFEKRTADAPGCVVADLAMPGLSGLDLQDALARSDSGLPVVFVSRGSFRVGSTSRSPGASPSTSGP